VRATEVVVGRQPVFDASMAIVGYRLSTRELRSTDPTGAQECVQPNSANTLSAALTVGIDRLVGNKSVFYDTHRGELTRAVPLLLSPKRLVVVVRDAAPLVPETVYACRALRLAGYRVALENFDWFDGAEELLPHASLVMLDVTALGASRTLELAERCREFGVERLAANVMAQEDLTLFRQYGCEYFTGYALARPTAVRGTGMEASLIGILQLAAAVLDDDTDLDEVERIVRRDPALTVQLLQVASVGSPGELRRPARSIREALVLMGTRRLRSWVSLLSLCSSAVAPADDLVTVLTRARMCELLAYGETQAAFAFTAGMISALDRLLGIPADMLAEHLPLDDELLDAAFNGPGEPGELVRRVIEFESGNRSDNHLQEIAMHALDWALQSAEVLATS
jgi:EAL and modified HD-GYP domain-containing signal transduction protein